MAEIHTINFSRISYLLSKPLHDLSLLADNAANLLQRHEKRKKKIELVFKRFRNNCGDYSIIIIINSPRGVCLENIHGSIFFGIRLA